MVCGPRRSATCNGSKSNCPRGASTFTGSRTGSPVCTQFGVTRCERCASYAAITRETPTYSFRSAAGLPISFHRLVFEEHTRHIFRSQARWRSELAWQALAWADRSVGLQHHSVVGFGRIEQRAALYLYGYRFYRPLDHFCRRASLRCKRGLDVLDHGFKLLVRQLLEQIAVFNLVLARDQQRQDFEVGGRLRLAHPRNSLLPMLSEVAQKRANDLLGQLVTRASRSSGRYGHRDATMI